MKKEKNINVKYCPGRIFIDASCVRPARRGASLFSLPPGRALSKRRIPQSDGHGRQSDVCHPRGFRLRRRRVAMSG